MNLRSTNYWPGSSQRRRPARQTWAIGAVVKSGFVTVRLISYDGGSWLAESLDGARLYTVIPHGGIWFDRMANNV